MKLNKLTQEYLKNKTGGYLSKDQKHEDLNKYLRLDLGENLLAYSNIDNILKSIDENTLRHYADPSNTSIKNTIASLHGISPRNISIANSADDAIDFIPRIVLNKSDKSLIITPTFFRIINSSMQNGAKVKFINLSENDEFKPNSALIDKICMISRKTHINIIWICNPNNPTGEVYDLENIEKLAATASNSLIVVDEAFYELYDPNNIHSAIKLINKFNNIIVLRSLSKAYGLAGLRFGYILSHPNVIEKIESYRDTLLMTSALIVKIAEASLGDQQFLQNTAQETKVLKEALFKEIKELENLHIGASTKTNIFLLKHLQKNLHQELLTRNILTADFRNAKGIEEKGYVRITIADKMKNEKLLKALSEVNKK